MDLRSEQYAHFYVKCASGDRPCPICRCRRCMDTNILYHSVHDDVEVYSDTSGLSLIKKDKNSLARRFIFISESASNALVHEVHVPPLYLEVLFSISPSVKNKSTTNYIVICNSCEVFLVLLEVISPKNSVKIGEIQGNVIWADIVSDCVLILESCGKLHVGSLGDKDSGVDPPEERSFKWKLILLSIEPICCCAFENCLVLSDGYSSYLYNFDNGATENKVQRLPYSGIISLRKVLSKLVLYSSDGRQYSKLLSTLKEDAQKYSEKCSPIDSLFVENISLVL
ncbi:hypothetical protein Anas_12685 [Armadillidium nasatum]|uniref:Uncharacterized protein n=1 Tax=Armadillidium nasatum TaxID=96803 RepID=A0A5N5TEI0_9CRUS|nr:hypothetical protein Anas_12685 [Armadillidium nasatum]